MGPGPCVGSTSEECHPDSICDSASLDGRSCDDVCREKGIEEKKKNFFYTLYYLLTLLISNSCVIDPMLAVFEIYNANLAFVAVLNRFTNRSLYHLIEYDKKQH